MFNEEPVFFVPICSVNALSRWLRLAAKCENVNYSISSHENISPRFIAAYNLQDSVI